RSCRSWSGQNNCSQFTPPWQRQGKQEHHMQRYAVTMGLIIVWSIGLTPSVYAADAPATQPATPASLAYDHFKSLAGNWEGKSTKGWTEQSSYQSIAGGSCVMERSFNAHPNESMVTMYYMDGPKLRLTHYCMAKNQPRMAATKISDDGSEVTFTF